MTMFEQPELPEETKEKPPSVPVKRPSRWSPSNWPVGWKVLAIVLIPILLAVAFGGLRVYNSFTDARALRTVSQRADMVKPIADYTGAMENALLAMSTDADAAPARKTFDDARNDLQRKLSATNVDPDVRTGISNLLNQGPQLLDQVAGKSIDLRDTVTSYAPILLTAEDAIIGSVRADDEKIRAQAQGLSRAVGARGQMFMQKLLLNRGGELPEPGLRTSMITLAGTEPSTLFGMNQVLGVGSADAKALQEQMLKRMSILSDPAAVLVGNAELLQSLQATDDIATKIINDTSASVTTGVHDQATSARNAAIRDAAIMIGATLIALLVVVLFAISLVRPLRRLREGALRVAHQDLPAEIERIGAGHEPPPIQPIRVHTTEEIGQVAHAVDELHEQALQMAAEQSRLQLHMSDMFETMSRRSRSLVDQQLSLIDDLERNEEDPRRLEALFELDHLAAQMRRSGTNLLVLSGAKVRREQSESMPISDVVKAAASQVENYQRVVTTTVPDSAVFGSVAADIVHLLAEVIDNALRYSPPESEVRVSGVHTGNRGLVVEVSDNGLGMTEADMRMANMRLESGGEVTPYTARHMGLFVVGRLARQHGLVVRLRSSVAGSPRSGMTVGVFIPAALIDRPGVAGWGMPEDQPMIDEGEAPETTPFFDAIAPPEAGAVGEPSRNGVAQDDESRLPQRQPGTSGIFGRPAHGVVPAEAPPEEEVRSEGRAPVNTSAFFASREQAAEQQNAPQPTESREEREESEPAARTRPPSSPLGDTDVIFQRMMSEWLIDPHDLMEPLQSWESVWDSGWAAAEQADAQPVERVTEHGLPVREPGARLVPGSAESGRPNGASHRKADDENGAVSSPEEPTAQRDPEAVRSSLSSHWGGVRSGRSHAREDQPQWGRPRAGETGE